MTLALLVAVSLAQPSAVPVSLADDGTILLGPQARPASQLELFEALGRADLVERVRARQLQRWVLVGVGSVLAAAGLAVGIAVLASPGPTTAECGRVTNFGSPCLGSVAYVSQAPPDIAVGSIAIGGGLAAGGLLVFLGLRSSPDVLGSIELRHLVGAAQGQPLTLRLTPWGGPGGGGLLARLTY